MSHIVVGHFEASGAAVALTWTGMDRNPDFLMAWNQTKFATTSTNVFLLWDKDYAAGDASIIQNDTTDGMMGVAETTNGVTQNDTVAYADTNSNTVATHTLNLTLGSAFYGADSDEIHFIAVWADEFKDYGDINA